MQAVAAEFSGCAGKFYSLLKRRVTRLLTLFNGGPPVLRAPILVLKFTRSLNLNNKGTRNVAIENKRLGKRGVLVSNICLGTMNFGWHTSQEESFKIMDRALELGINFFDTADVYGWGGEQGDTEEILGRWFAQGGGRRDAVVLATKVFNPVKRKANLAEPKHGRPQPFGVQDPQALRRQPKTAPDRPHRPLPDAPRGSGLPMGRDLAGLRTTGKPGQGGLRGIQQLRGMGHRHCLSGSFQTRFDRSLQRTKHLPPEQPHAGTGGHPRLPTLRLGTDPVEPPGRRPSGRSPGEAGKRPAYQQGLPEGN